METKCAWCNKELDTDSGHYETPDTEEVTHLGDCGEEFKNSRGITKRLKGVNVPKAKLPVAIKETVQVPKKPVEIGEPEAAVKPTEVKVEGDTKEND